VVQAPTGQIPADAKALSLSSTPRTSTSSTPRPASASDADPRPSRTPATSPCGRQGSRQGRATLGSSEYPQRHGRARPGHPRLCRA
jgi:hypothetical protein